MYLSKFLPLHKIAMTAGLLAAAACQAQLAPPAFSKLDIVQTQPEFAGALVYRGATFAQRQPAGSPLFRYERRFLDSTSGPTANHITSDPTGRVIILESATVSDQ